VSSRDVAHALSRCEGAGVYLSRKKDVGVHRAHSYRCDDFAAAIEAGYDQDLAIAKAALSIIRDNPHVIPKAVAAVTLKKLKTLLPPSLREVKP
jgi:hypothetical protein